MMIRSNSQFFIPSAKTENGGRPQIRYLESGEFADLSLRSETGVTIDLSINSETYVMTIKLKNPNGIVLSQGEIDLPLETMVVNARYEYGKLILVLKNGSELEIDISDIVDGLVNDVKVNGTSVKDGDGVANITVPTQLRDLTADSTHRTVTDVEKTTWNGKQDALTFDNTPTANSDNPVKIKGIFSALSWKLGTCGDGQNVTVTFSQGTKVDVATDFATGSKLSTLFGKIKAWFASLKGLAFKDKTEIGDYTAGSIYNADIADSAKIAQSKIDGLTGALNGKQATITGAATTITGSNLTASRALIANGSGKVAVSDITSTELGYLDWVTSNIQTQLNGKQSNLTFDSEPTSGSNNPVQSKGIYKLTSKIAICSTAASTQIKEVSLPDYTLRRGNMISIYFINANTATQPTLNINGTGAKPIYYDNSRDTATTALTAGWHTFVYNGTNYYTGNYLSNGIDAEFAYSSAQLRQYVNILAGEAITANRLIGARDDNKYYMLGAGKQISTLQPILFANAAISANVTGNNNWLIRHQTAANMFNNGSSLTMTPYAPVFLVGTLNGHIFTTNSGTWWTQTIPTTEDGFQYMLIGYAYSTTNVRLFPEHPIYEFKGGSFGLYEKRNNTCARGVDDSSNYAGYFKIAETTLPAWYMGSKAQIIVSDFDDPNTAILTVTAQINNNGDTSESRIGITETTNTDRWNGRFFLVVRQNSSVNASAKKVELWYKNPSNLTYQRITATFIYDNPNNRYSGNHNNIEWTKFYRTSAQDKSYVSAGLTDLANGYIPEGGWSTAFSGDTIYPNYSVISDNLTNILQMANVRLGTTYKYYLPPVGLTQYETESYLAVNKGVSLWVGSIASGSITLPTQATKYAVFRISFGDDSSTFNTEIIATKRGSASDTVRGIGGYRPTTNGALQIYDVSFTISGNTWTLVTATRNDFNLNTSSGNITGYRTAGYIKQIIGVC